MNRYQKYGYAIWAAFAEKLFPLEQYWSLQQFLQESLAPLDETHFILLYHPTDFGLWTVELS